ASKLSHEPRTAPLCEAWPSVSRFRCWGNPCADSIFETNRKTALIAWRQSFRAGMAVNDACRLPCSRHAPPPAVEDHSQPVQLGTKESPSDQGRFLRLFACIKSHASCLPTSANEPSPPRH